MTVIINDIIWLDTIVEKLAWKHTVLPYEVEEVLSGRCRIFKSERGKVEGEDLYNALGRTNTGRYLSVFFIKKLGNKALVITARDMNKRERGRYEKK
ncbi:MAG: BrnT family toxin [Nitrospirae bacterium]|nr:BrnT family toxin [Nitrospirota bacterium]